MSNDIRTKVLEIQVNAGKSIQNIASYNTALDECRKKEDDLKKARNEGNISEQEYQETLALLKVEMKEYRDAIAENNKQIRNQIKANDENQDSLKSMRANLSNLTKAYDELSKAEREGAKGVELQNQIKSLSEEIKTAEEATGRFYRNVGNYKESILQAAASTSGATGAISGMVGGMSKGITGIKAFNTALNANPIGAIVSVVMVLIGYIDKLSTRTSEGSNKIGQAFGMLGTVIARISDAIGEALGGVLNVIGWVVDGAVKLANKFGLISDETMAAAESAAKLKKEERDLYNLETEMIVKQQELSTEIEKQKALMADQTKSAAERKKAGEEAVRLLNEQANLEREAAKRKYDLIVAQNALSNSTDEDLRKEAEALRDLQKVETDNASKKKELLGQISGFRKAEADAAKAASEKIIKAREEEAKILKDAKDKEREAIRQAEDAMNALLTDGLLKQQELVNTQYDRQIEDLKQKLETEKNLTLEAKKAINDTIIALDKQRDQELEKLSVEHVQKDAQAKADAYQKEVDAMKLHWENVINEAALNGQNTLQLELERRKAELDAVQQMEGESNDAFRARELEARKNKAEAEKALADYEVQIQQDKALAIGSITGALSGMLEELGEDNKALAKAAKVLALGEIAVNQGVAISEGIKVASATGPFPLNLPAIATTIATVITGMTSAIKTVKSAKFATGGVFEGSGYVSGAGTGTSDSINARLSNGESVNTALATSMFAPLYSTLNQMGGGVPINVADSSNQAMGEAMLARAVARGVAAMPAPVVAVTEINRVGRQVQVVENLGNI